MAAIHSYGHADDFVCVGCHEPCRGVAALVPVPALRAKSAVCHECAERMRHDDSFKQQVAANADQATRRAIVVRWADALGIEPNVFVAAVQSLDADEAAIEVHFGLARGTMGAAYIRARA